MVKGLTIPSPFFFFSSRRRHTRFKCDWSSDVCSSDLRCGASGAGGTRLASPGDEARIAQARCGLAVAERIAADGDHLAARGFEHGLPRRLVPFPGWAETGIHVGLASRD